MRLNSCCYTQCLIPSSNLLYLLILHYSSSVAFLDEVFKANSAILNSLLTILNERKFDNGNQRVEVPLMAVVAASNELPDNEELDALYDRFLIRKVGHTHYDVMSLQSSLPLLLLRPSLLSLLYYYCDHYYDHHHYLYCTTTITTITPPSIIITTTTISSSNGLNFFSHILSLTHPRPSLHILFR